MGQFSTEMQRNNVAEVCFSFSDALVHQVPMPAENTLSGGFCFCCVAVLFVCFLLGGWGAVSSIPV